MNRSSNSRGRRLNLYSWAWFLVFGALGLGILFHGWIRTTRESRAFREVNAVAYRNPLPTISVDAQRSPTYGLRNIEDVRVGDRVFADNPEISDEERAQLTEPDWSTWRRVHLEMEKPAGGVLRIEMLRPRTWFVANRARPGWFIFLDLPEMGAQGQAEVLSTSACPRIQTGPGRVVTATFAHPPSIAVLDVQFEGEPEPIGVTEKHRFWSVDRGEFAEIGEMSIGERVQTYHGDAKRIVQKRPRPGPCVVYNLEVYGEHVFFVGGQGLLAHNTCNKSYGRRWLDNWDDAFGSQSSSNRGLTWTTERTGRSSRARIWEDSGPGASSDITTRRRRVPALRYDNPNPKRGNLVRFDGIAPDNPLVLIDRKWGVTTKSGQVRKFQNGPLEALRQNPRYHLRIEVPNRRAAVDARRLIRYATGSDTHPQINVAVITP